MRPPLFRRCVHTLADDAHTRDALRALLRETAQSVAVVTARLPDEPLRHRHQPSNTPTYHGATLSSFSSIALDPFPLVAFSLRVPSRMAFALNVHVASSSSSSSSSLHPHYPSPAAHLVINILSAAQHDLADCFARPDLHPRPFEDPRVSWSHSRDGLPILSGALGALSCTLVGPSLPLARLYEPVDVDNPWGEGEGSEEVRQASRETGLASELFIARLLRVERVPLASVDDEQGRAGLHSLPLVYHRRRYTTVEDPDQTKS